MSSSNYLDLLSILPAVIAALSRAEPCARHVEHEPGRDHDPEAQQRPNPFSLQTCFTRLTPLMEKLWLERCWGGTQSQGSIFRGKGFIAPQSHLVQTQPWARLVFPAVPLLLKAMFPENLFLEGRKGRGRGERRGKESGKGDGGRGKRRRKGKKKGEGESKGEGEEEEEGRETRREKGGNEKNSSIGKDLHPSSAPPGALFPACLGEKNLHKSLWVPSSLGYPIIP